MKIIVLLVFLSTSVSAQHVGRYLPQPIHKSDKFIFYLHGGAVTNRGDMAVNASAPEWGPYEYHHILDSLTKRGFNVVSERRMPDVDDSVYVRKVAQQIDSLLHAGLNPSSIIVVGASAGGDIALRVFVTCK
jgi:acetyl esterase/lipase